MKNAYWWWLSAIVSALLAAVLVYQWQAMNSYAPARHSLVSKSAVDEYLQHEWQSRTDPQPGAVEPMQQVRTGIFVQSLRFINSTEVNISGYIWQRYEAGVQDHIKPARDEIGFILPEQVNSGGDIDAREVFRLPYVDDGRQGEVIGWYFEATLRQPFDYSHYPFDHKTAWVRLWHREFWRNIVLVPDFDAYKDLDESGEYNKNCGPDPGSGQALPRVCTFGINEDIVLGTWQRELTYFDYAKANYDTNFGISDYVGQYRFPELRYNFVLKRKFENAFIVYLLPLFLVAMLLFAALLTVSGKNELSERLGFNAAGFIGACSALFFVVLLAHIQLREQFSAAGIVYIEYFYILMYIMLVLGTVNVYLFSIRPGRWCGWILYEDNIFFKVAYWPVVLGCLILVTLGVK